MKFKISNGAFSDFVMFDDEDIELVFNFKWAPSKHRHTHYARSSSNIVNGSRKVYMHHLIIPRNEGMIVDHINGNGLDNRRSNLRLCTYSQNAMNSKSKKDGKFKGVFLLSNNNESTWAARIWVSRTSVNLGVFKTEVEAAAAYNEAALKYHGEFAKLNLIEGDI